MNALNAKIMYSVLWMIVTASMAAWLVLPVLRELGYQSVGITIKPAWFLGKSNNHRSKTWLGKVRFYNHRRTYMGGHRGVKW